MEAKTILNDIHNLVLAGGGSRCVWQGAFWNELNRYQPMQPKIIGAVNSSALVACLLFSGRFEQAVVHLKQLATGNIRNSNWANLFRGKDVFPHAKVYRQIILNCIDDQALETLQQFDIRIQITRIPRWLPSSLGMPLGYTAGRMDKVLTRSIHSQFARRLGLRAETISLQQCESPKDLLQLLLASSSRPPFMPIGEFAGRPALDGSLVDNVPLNTVINQLHKKTLILLTQRYDHLPILNNRVYVQPSRPIPMATWDCADPNRIQMAYELGREDAQSFIRDSIESPVFGSAA